MRARALHPGRDHAHEGRLGRVVRRKDHLHLDVRLAVQGGEAHQVAIEVAPPLGALVEVLQLEAPGVHVVIGAQVEDLARIRWQAIEMLAEAFELCDDAPCSDVGLPARLICRLPCRHRRCPQHAATTHILAGRSSCCTHTLAGWKAAAALTLSRADAALTFSCPVESAQSCVGL